MLDAGQGFRLLAKSLNDCLILPGERGGQHFQGENSIRVIAVAHLEYHAHPAFAQLIEHNVGSDEEAFALALVNGCGLVPGKRLTPNQLLGELFHVARTMSGGEPADDLSVGFFLRLSQFGEELVKRGRLSDVVRALLATHGGCF
jgi:hypothetical protein